MPRRDKMPRQVLVTRFSALGDVAMTVPVLYEACMANPKTRFVMLTRASVAGIFVNPPENLVIEGVDLKKYKGVRGLWKLGAELERNYGIDTVLDLHDVVRTKVLRFFMRLRKVKVFSIDKGRKEKRRLTRRRDKVLLPLKTTIERYAAVFSAAGLKMGGAFRSIYQDKPADVTLFASVSSPKKEGERWIAIAPFAKHKGKIYPRPLMEKVIEHFDKAAGHKLFVFGAGDKEREIIAEWAKKYLSVVNMADKRLGFPGELALISQCDVMLSMDSANMHFASIAGTRVVSVWGATHPYCGFTGWRQNPNDCVELDMVCRPCSVFGNKPCARGDYHCMWGINPGIIISRLS